MEALTAQTVATSVDSGNPQHGVVARLTAATEVGVDNLPGWLHAARRRWQSLANEVQLPTTRDEDWRFTNLTPLLHRRFRAATRDHAVTGQALERYLLSGSDWVRLVFVNGFFDQRLSSGVDDQVVEVATLSGRVMQPPEWVAAHFNSGTPGQSSAFAVLNEACFGDAACIGVGAKGAECARIQLVFLTTCNGAPVSVHPRVLVEVGSSAQAVVCETHAAAGAGEYLSNPLTELHVQAGARLEYYRVQCESDAASHIGLCRLRQKRDSNVDAHFYSFGGALVRQEIETFLEEPGGACHLRGLSVAGRRQHMDTHLRIVHGAPHTTSREVFKSILTDDARGVFSGRIIVRPGAQKTDAKQSNSNLLLSDNARAHSRPQLEIFADDVKCTHGATAGRLNEQALFYLRSRGLPLAAARALLVHGFAAEMLAEVGSSDLRKQLEAALCIKLEGCLGSGDTA